MPVYAVRADLKKKLATLQAKGEVITSVVQDDGEWVIVTQLPEDTTGRPHVPSWDRETR